MRSRQPKGARGSRQTRVRVNGWLAVDAGSSQDWLELAREAQSFVAVPRA